MCFHEIQPAIGDRVIHPGGAAVITELRPETGDVVYVINTETVMVLSISLRWVEECGAWIQEDV